MKATTSIAVIAAWIWIFQGCDTKGHQIKNTTKVETSGKHITSINPVSANEHLAFAICNK